MRRQNNIAFLKSAYTTCNKFNDTNRIQQWLTERKESTRVEINPIRFKELRQWGFDEGTGNLRHESGKFFSIDGINVDVNAHIRQNWSQPIINQPEIGFLGIITKEIDGVLYFLLQAKVEPGNINFVQLSPTLQATKSNYTRVHKGKAPAYLEYFLEKKNCKVLLDQFQSEQGARFLKKRNRNIIIQVEDDIPVYDDFIWVTLGQILELLNYDNLVNMDTRTVISCIPFGEFSLDVVELFNSIDGHYNQHSEYGKKLLKSAINSSDAQMDTGEIISWITTLKMKYELNIDRIPLSKVKSWEKDDYSIFHRDKKYFSVMAVDVEIHNREVASWTQPILQSAQEGIIAFVTKEIDGILHFLVQAKVEAGNFDIVELAPTVQCLTGNYRDVNSTDRPPFLDYILNASPDQIRHSSYQSEEGGRFYREQNKNIVIEAGEDFPEELPENYNWMTLNQIKNFIRFNNYFNIQSRSLISTLNFI